MDSKKIPEIERAMVNAISIGRQAPLELPLSRGMRCRCSCRLSRAMRYTSPYNASSSDATAAAVDCNIAASVTVAIPTHHVQPGSAKTGQPNLEGASLKKA